MVAQNTLKTPVCLLLGTFGFLLSIEKNSLPLLVLVCIRKCFRGGEKCVVPLTMPISVRLTSVVRMHSNGNLVGILVSIRNGVSIVCR